MLNHYGATPERPFHLSVALIILDKDNQIICLHYPKIDHLENIFTLPCKTVHTNETLEAAIERCALEELGYTVSTPTYLGSSAIQDTWWGELGTPAPVEKSLLYFVARAQNVKPELAAEGNIQEHREVVTKSFDFLINTMNTLQTKDGMRDYNHSRMLLRAKEWVNAHPNLVG